MSELRATAQKLLVLAEEAQLRRPRDAMTLGQSAASIARAIHDPALEMEAERLGARLAYALGELEVAEASFVAAKRAAIAAADPLAAARIEASLAFLAYDRGQALAAHERLDGVRDALAELPASRPGVGRLAALLDGYRGNLARQADALDEARALYRRALERARTDEAAVPSATFAMDLGATELAEGRLGEAGAWLGRAGREVGKLPPGSARSLLEPLVAHYRALRSIAAGARDSGAVELEGPRSLFELRAWLFDATAPASRRGALGTDLRRRLERIRESAVAYEHARFGARLVARLTAIDPIDVVVISRDGSLLATGASVADLSEREPLRRLLEGLARALPTGEPLGIEALVAIGWPKERIEPRAARNRAHVALSTLRTLGLGTALVRVASGYRLDAALVRIEA